MTISVKKLKLGLNAIIEDGCIIKANRLVLGDGAKISKNCKISCNTLIIGDFTTICENLRVDCGNVIIGDYGIIYSDCLFYGKEQLTIGHNFFLGGGSILNSYAPLVIGNGVGIGTSSQVWTHASWGEELEGCSLATVAPTTIQEGAWLVGHTIVGAGVNIGKYSTIMSASMFTKNTSEKSVWGGVPCKDISSKVSSYKEMSLDDKFNFMLKHCQEFAKKNSAAIQLNVDGHPFISIAKGGNEVEIYSTFDFNILLGKTRSIWSISNKTYNKTKNSLEVELMMYLKKGLARFYPLEN